MDFNTYDFLGNPPAPKTDNIEWCEICVEHTPTNVTMKICIFCGGEKSNQPLHSEAQNAAPGELIDSQ